MHLIFLFGQPASGKLTIAKALAARTGLALFHNHLVVDAVGAVFPFGSESFARLRERFWLDTFEEAANTGRSLIFTFAPEPTVAPDFPRRVRTQVEAAEGKVVFVALTVPPVEQQRRLGDTKTTPAECLRDDRPAPPGLREGGDKRLWIDLGAIKLVPVIERELAGQGRDPTDQLLL